MARRSALPGADELFRSTGNGPTAPVLEPARPAAVPDAAPPSVPPTQLSPRRLEVSSAPGARDPEPPSAAGVQTTEARPGRAGGRSTGVRKVTRAKQAPGAAMLPSGRERHEEKITVYVSPQELLDLERARWVLRAEHGLASDRGRIVREAVAVVLADFEAKGADSILVTRLLEG